MKCTNLVWNLNAGDVEEEEEEEEEADVERNNFVLFFHSFVCESATNKSLKLKENKMKEGNFVQKRCESFLPHSVYRFDDC